MKKTKVKSTKQFNKNNEIKSVRLGEINHSVLMYDKESIDNISSNLSIDYTEKNTLLSNEIFTKINSLSSSHKTNFNNLSNLIAKNIDFIKTISVDLSDDISNIVDFNNKISTLNKSLDDLSVLYKEDIEELSSRYETDPVFTEWKEANTISIGKNAVVSSENGIAIGTNAQTEANNSIQLGEGTNTSSGTLQFRNYPLVDNSGKIFEERIPDKIINIVNNLSNMTDLSDSLSIVNFLSEKIDTEIANLSNKHKEDIDELSFSLKETNNSIFELSNEFNSEIAEIKAENILSFCEIYDAITNLSRSVSQDIENLYNDLSDEIHNVNDAIIDLSDVLSNEVFILNSKIDNLSNDLENSINESINNMIIDEVMENSNSLVKSSGIFKALQKDFVEIELSANKTIPLKNNTVYSITTESNEITPTLQFPITGKGSDEILISIKSENSTGVKYNIDESNNRAALIYTQDGKLAFDHSNDNYAIVIKGEFDGLFWYIHDHIYKRVIDNTITIILSGKNNCGKIQSQEQLITITYDNMNSVKINEYANPDIWNSLFDGKCKLLGWTTNETFSGNNPEYTTDHIFKFTENDFGKVFTLYPIYEIEEVSISETFGENKDYNCPTSWTKIDGKTINVKQYMINKGYDIEKQFDGSVGIPFGFGVIARIKGRNDRYYSSASKFGWDDSVYGTAFGNNYTVLLDEVGIGEHSSEEIWLHNLTWTNGTQSITLYGNKVYAGDQVAAYQLFIKKIKIGFNRYNLFKNCKNVPMFPNGRI